MGMFLNYHNIADNYVPNNLIKAFPFKQNVSKLDPQSASKPYEEYNTKGDLCGYFWREGETLNLEFNLDGEITVESDAMILTVSGQEPAGGDVGQRAYNIIDLISWTCVAKDDESIWEKDPEFVYPTESERSVYLSASDFLKDKQIRVVLYDFRLQPIYEEVFPGQTKIILSITPELSSKMKRGIYYCTVDVFNSFVQIRAFDTTDGHLLVK